MTGQTWRDRMSIRGKVIGGTVFLVSLVALFNFLYYPPRERRQMTAALGQRAEALANMLALGVGAGLDHNDVTAVRAALQLARGDPQLTFVAAADTTGEVFASYGRRPASLDVREAGAHPPQRIDNTLEIAVPIGYGGRRLGALHVGMSLDALRADLRRQRVVAVVGLALLLVAGLVVGMVFAGRLTAPLRALEIASELVAGGRYDVPLPRGGGKEVAALSATFGVMVERVRQAVDTLRGNQRQLAEAQSIAHVGSWEFDMVASRVTWSDEAYRLWGLPLGSPVDYTAFIAGVHPEDRARVEQVVGEGLAERRNIEFECRIVRPNGDVRYLFNRNIVVTNGAGEPIRLAGTCLDITEQRITEERLRASLAEVKVLQGILPICASCKRIRTDGGQWEAVESYVRDRTNAEFSHGLCPDCARRDWGAGPSK
jgi:PAS domain S-box-containing protein